MVDGRYCYSLSSPSRLNGIATLFGLTAIDPARANILELGCGSGGNIIPLSARFPNSTFVGVEPSLEKIDLAKKQSLDLNLDNIQFFNESIADLDLGDEKFDYIIAPRLYSLASDGDQERIFEIMRDFLSPNGIAFVSYNTLPGWNSVKTLRDMMLFHGRNFNEPDLKVLEARRMLKFVSDNFNGNDIPNKKLLEAEIKFIDTVPYEFVIDDYYGNSNDPCYFYKFMEKANAKGLTYLADSDLPSMYLGNQTVMAAETLKDIVDIVEQEQYVDFLTNRRYRSTLLVKDTVKIERALTPKSAEGLHFIPAYKLTKPLEEIKENLVDGIDLVNLQNPEQTASISGEILSVCYLELIKSSPVPQSIEEIASAACTVLKMIDKDAIRQALEENVLDFIFKGLLIITADQEGFGNVSNEKPEVFKAARLDAPNRTNVPNMRHEMVQLSGDQRILMQYCTGENSKEAIFDAIKSHVLKGELTVKKDDVSVWSEGGDLEKHLPLYIDEQLEIFNYYALLITSK